MVAKEQANAQSAQQDKALAREAATGRFRRVPPPPMREVRKGWFSVTERQVPASEFEEADRRRG